MKINVDVLTLLGMLLSFFSLFWVITNARIQEIIKRLERIEEILFNGLKFRKAKGKKKKEEERKENI